MARARNVGIDLNAYDAFGNKRKDDLPPIQPPLVNVPAATRRLERLVPKSSYWSRHNRLVH